MRLRVGDDRDPPASAGRSCGSVTQVDTNSDGTTTYDFSIKVADSETMAPTTGDDNQPISSRSTISTGSSMAR
jgi:hypothetical protein